MVESTSRGLDRTSFPMRLWAKAKVQGAWNPSDIDLARDRQEWEELPETVREQVLQLCALFYSGEEAVTVELLPLVQVVAAEGRTEETIYLTSFLWEEAKHTDLFDRFLAEVVGDSGDLSRFSYPSHERMFGQELPAALGRLASDPSPEAQVSASVTYHLLIEGVMAETGYYLFRRILSDGHMLPGIRRAIELISRDESRHVAFGMYFLSRLIIEQGTRAYGAFLNRVSELQPVVDQIGDELMTGLETESMGRIDIDDVRRYSERQLSDRVQRIVKARSRSLQDLDAIGLFWPEG